MSINTRVTGITIEAPDDVIISDVPTTTTPAPALRRRSLPRGPVPLPTSGSLAPENDPVISAMTEQDLIVVDSFDIIVPRGADRRGPRAPSRLTLDVADKEDSVLLLEQDGVYSWRYPQEAMLIQPATPLRGPVRTAAVKRVTFDLSVEPTSRPDERKRRGPVSDLFIGAVRTYVFRFVARVALEPSIGFLERKNRTGLVRVDIDDPLRWSPFEHLGELRLPTDRPARILLLVHGTFSSTVGSYGALGVSQWGQAFLARARAHYDAIIGYDHRTLSLDPLQNAEDLLGRLERTAAPALEIDAVAFSRGGLVLRSVIEYLLPSSSLRARVQRAVFVGATNAGTQLASPENWKRLIDLVTNLVSAGSRVLGAFAPLTVAATITRQSIATLGALVKCIAAEALTEGAVPGLAAMMPTGRFVMDINEAQPGQPAAADALYYAVTSNFDALGVLEGNGAPELPARLAQWFIDSLADLVLREPNDLVVNTASMTAIDMGSGVFVKDRFDFGTNSQVYHTIYFTRPEVVSAMTRWLRLGARAEIMEAAPLPAGADNRVVTLHADESVATVCRTIRSSRPTFVIAERFTDWGSRYRYAFRSEELLKLEATLGTEGASQSLQNALVLTPLEMHEETSTPEGRPENLGTVAPRKALTGARFIVVDGDTPRAVIERGASIPSSIDLATVSRRAAPSRGSRGRGGRGAVTEVAPETSPYTRPQPEVITEVAPETAPRSPRPDTSGGRGPEMVPEVAPETSPIRRSRPEVIAEVAPETAPRPPQAPSPGSMPKPTRPGADEEIDRLARERLMGEDPGSRSVPPARGTVYFSGEIPSAIPVGVVAPLSVVVSHDEITGMVGPSAGAARAVVGMDRRLLVQVIAKRNVVIEEDDRAEIDPAVPRTELLFQVKGVSEGEGEVRVLVSQGPFVLASLKLQTWVTTATLAPTTTTMRDADAADLSDPSTESFPVLQIFQWQGGNEVKYHFVLQRRPGDYISEYSAALKRPQDEYVAGIYKDIEDRWLSTNGDFRDFQEELRTMGSTLLDELVPPGVQAALWEVRDSLKTIQVVAEEPFIPWELVHLKEPRGPGGRAMALTDESHFLAQKGLVRWLHGKGRAPLAVTVRRGRSYYAIPKYPHPDYDLPAAQEEIPLLVGLFHSKPVEAEIGHIRDLLRTPGNVDHFHYSGHGEADAQRAVEAQLMLGGTIENNAWVPRFLKADLIAQTSRLIGPNGEQPLVMLNACQVGRAGWRLTSIGGFAESFIRAGAGVFVGSLWSVGDKPARTFSEAFYTALKEGSTLSQATIIGREEARGASEGTWLSYVVYGYPHAQLNVE